jgi:hypothetical protein
MVTPLRVFVVVLLAAVVLATVAGAGYLTVFAIALAIALVGVVGLGVVHGMRAGIARAREEAASEQPGGPADNPPGTHSAL